MTPPEALQKLENANLGDDWTHFFIAGAPNFDEQPIAFRALDDNDAKWIYWRLPKGYNRTLYRRKPFGVVT